MIQALGVKLPWPDGYFRVYVGGTTTRARRPTCPDSPSCLATLRNPLRGVPYFNMWVEASLVIREHLDHLLST